MRARAIAFGAVLALTTPVAADPSVPNAAVRLQGLDKVTARVVPIEARIDEVVRLGSLAIRARACFSAPPTEPPESAAFLEIAEVDDEGRAELVFSGWMYASSPGLSALEHPVYDVWVLSCEEPSDEPPPADVPPETPSATQRPNG